MGLCCRDSHIVGVPSGQFTARIPEFLFAIFLQSKKKLGSIIDVQVIRKIRIIMQHPAKIGCPSWIVCQCL